MCIQLHEPTPELSDLVLNHLTTVLYNIQTLTPYSTLQVTPIHTHVGVYHVNVHT